MVTNPREKSFPQLATRKQGRLAIDGVRRRVGERQQSRQFQRQTRRHRRGSQHEQAALLGLTAGNGLKNLQCRAADVIDFRQIDHQVRGAMGLLEQRGLKLGRTSVTQPALDEKHRVSILG